jgi:hypothetical protein
MRGSFFFSRRREDRHLGEGMRMSPEILRKREETRKGKKGTAYLRDDYVIPRHPLL